MNRIAFITVLLAACGGPPKSSVQRVAYPDGSPHFEYQVQDGVPHGTGRVWHPNGELSSQGEYVNGLKHGKFTFYDEEGRFAHHAFFWRNVEVWRSSVADEDPPADLIKGLTAFSGSQPPRLGESAAQPEAAPAPTFKISKEPPAPFFASLDRTTGLNRVGAQFGFGSANETDFGSVTRLELFGNYRFSRFGAYGQLSQTLYEPVPGMTLSGRRTLEGGATYHLSPAVGDVAMRLGLLVPLGNDTTDGYIASTAGAYQRPADAATSFPSTAGIRTGASLTRTIGSMVLQGDTGVDVLLGGSNASVDALLRANGGVGWGMRSLMIGVEASNAVRISDPTRRMHAIGLSGTFWINRMWMMGFLSASLDGSASITGAVGYEL